MSLPESESESGPGEPGRVADEVEVRRRRLQALLARPSSSGSLRLLVAAGLGAAVAVVLALVGPVRYAALGGLMTVAGAYVVWTYLALRRFAGQGTRAHAHQEDPRSGLRQAGATVVILGNLAAVVTLLLLDDRTRNADLDAGLAVLAVVLSWFLLHTLYVPHYARLYYGPAEHGLPELVLTVPGTTHQVRAAGGIDFNAPGYWPSYADFTYFAFNLGMTFQVSDTSVSSPAIRRLVLGHCLLSYFFATAITATVINLVVGLVS